MENSSLFIGEPRLLIAEGMVELSENESKQVSGGFIGAFVAGLAAGYLAVTFVAEMFDLIRRGNG